MSSKGLWLRLLKGALFGICAFSQIFCVIFELRYVSSFNVDHRCYSKIVMRNDCCEGGKFINSWFFFFWQVMNFMQTQEWGLMILDGECSTFPVPKTSIHWNAKKASCLDNLCWPFFRRLCYFLFWIHDIHSKTVHFKNAFSIECREPKPGGWSMKNNKGTIVWDLKFNK